MMGLVDVGLDHLGALHRNGRARVTATARARVQCNNRPRGVEKLTSMRTCQILTPNLDKRNL